MRIRLTLLSLLLSVLVLGCRFFRAEARVGVEALRPVPLFALYNSPSGSDTANLRQWSQAIDLAVLHEWSSASKLAAIRSYNPDITLLCYKNRDLKVSTSIESVDAYPNQDHNASWFQHDSTGRPIITDWDKNGTQDYVATMPNNRAYQDFFAERAFDQVARAGFDGLFIDDLWTYRNPYSTPLPREFTSDHALQAATVDFLVRQRMEAQERGLILSGNIGWWRQKTSTGGRAGRLYVDLMNFGLDEKFFTIDVPRDIESNWLIQVRGLVADISPGHTLLAYARGAATNTDLYQYALGSFLCVWGPNDPAYFQYDDEHDNPRGPYLHFPTIEARAARLGLPLAETQWSSTHSVGYRRFQGGTVIVNPQRTSRTVSGLANGLYREDKTRVGSSVTLPAATARIYLTAP